jgi:anti-anti-sigma regulatory factor
VLRERLATQGPGLRRVVCDLSTSPYVDIAGARLLQRLHEEVRARGADLRVVEARGGVRDLLRGVGLDEHVGRISRRTSLAEAISDGD